jgi:hypothetical protein
MAYYAMANVSIRKPIPPTAVQMLPAPIIKHVLMRKHAKTDNANARPIPHYAAMNASALSSIPNIAARVIMHANPPNHASIKNVLSRTVTAPIWKCAL